LGALAGVCYNLYREAEKILSTVARLSYGYSYVEALLGERKIVIWCTEEPPNIVADLYKVEERDGNPYEVFLQRVEFRGDAGAALKLLTQVAGLERVSSSIKRHLKILSAWGSG